MAVVLAAAPLPASASASGGPGDNDAPALARDVSFPQCGLGLPGLGSGVSGILGTNNGSGFTRNPCLVAELAWAKRLPYAPAFYANTGNPGPARAPHWPLGQSTPRRCSSSDPNSLGCSYDYGWNSAWQSYGVAVDAAQRLHHVSRANARHRAANVDWWLDVETMNSWQSNERSTNAAGQARDAAALAGDIDALHAAGVVQVGVYSTAYQWSVIAGTSRATRARFAGVPQWLAGYQTRAGAVAGCRAVGFTEGQVLMTQYLGHDGFDADVICPASFIT